MGEDFAQTTNLLWQYINPLLYCKRTKNFPQPPPQLESKERSRFAARENFERAAKATYFANLATNKQWEKTLHCQEICFDNTKPLSSIVKDYEFSHSHHNWRVKVRIRSSWNFDRAPALGFNDDILANTNWHRCSNTNNNEQTNKTGEWSRPHSFTARETSTKLLN